MSHLSEAVVRWQRQHGRHSLPWQGSRDPYRVWLSEIMLQQTQVSTVLCYYDRFLARFPDVVALAQAPLDDVLALWSGLGYYSRARNLHRCAQAVVADHGGVFPASAEGLAGLPGIGRSTAAAIASFCFDERVAILDGNVKRVLTRALAFDGDLAVPAQERRLWDLATALLPLQREDMPAYTQGLMDLGATVCTRSRPNCLLCPLADPCRARAQGEMTRYPVRTRKLKRSRRESWCLWLSTGEAVWLQQRPAQGIWAGLWTTPLFESEAALAQAVQACGLAAMATAPAERLPSVEHALTHLDWTLHLQRWQISPAPVLTPAVQEALGGAGRWWAYADLAQVGLPAPWRRWLDRG